MVENIYGDLISEKGRTISFDKKTSRTCPSCNPNGTRENRVLHIVSNIENSVTLECPTCAYQEHRPISEVPESYGSITDIKGRPIR